VGAVAVCLVDGKIVWTNSRASDFDAGLEHEVVDLVPASDRPAVHALLAEAATGRDGIPVSVAIRNNHGSWVPRSMVSLLADERQCLLYLAPPDTGVPGAVIDRADVVAAATSLSGTVLWATPASGRFLDAPESEIVGSKLWDLAPLHAAALHRLFARTIDDPAGEFGERITTRSGDRGVSFDLYVGHFEHADFDGLLWWANPVAVTHDDSPVGAPVDVRVDTLVAALDTIAREVDRCGFVGRGGAPSAPELRGFDRLTERERTIVGHLARGLRPAAIAERLFVTPSAVRNHLSAIYRKLEVPNQAVLLERLLEDPGIVTDIAAGAGSRPLARAGRPGLTA